jgi:hypothetical protein
MPNADFSSTVPWSGIIGLPSWMKSAPLTKTFKWTPGTVSSGGSIKVTVGLSGLNFGMAVQAVPPYTLKGMGVSACVNKMNTAEIVLINLTGGTATLAAGNWKILATAI